MGLWAVPDLENEGDVKLHSLVSVSHYLGIIKKIKSPLLLLHGYKDYVINIAFGKKVFEAAPKPKEALFIQNAGHNNLFEFNLVNKILNYLKKY